MFNKAINITCLGAGVLAMSMANSAVNGADCDDQHWYHFLGDFNITVDGNSQRQSCLASWFTNDPCEDGGWGGTGVVGDSSNPWGAMTEEGNTGDWMKMFYWSRGYVGSSSTSWSSCPSHDLNSSEWLQVFHLMDKTISFDVQFNSDDPAKNCGCVSTLYLINNPGFNRGSIHTDQFYCDANGVGGQHCIEVDLMEANMYGFSAALHNLNDQVGCPIKVGEGVSSVCPCDPDCADCSGDGKKYGCYDWGRQQYAPHAAAPGIDTTQKFTVHCTFNSHQDDGEILGEFIVRLTQDLGDGDREVYVGCIGYDTSPQWCNTGCTGCKVGNCQHQNMTSTGQALTDGMLLVWGAQGQPADGCGSGCTGSNPNQSHLVDSFNNTCVVPQCEGCQTPGGVQDSSGGWGVGDYQWKLANLVIESSSTNGCYAGGGTGTWPTNSSGGDLDGDGDVDTNDLNALHAAVGICQSDINHDGATNVLDLLAVIDEWGSTCP